MRGRGDAESPALCVSAPSRAPQFQNPLGESTGPRKPGSRTARHRGRRSAADRLHPDPADRTRRRPSRTRVHPSSTARHQERSDVQNSFARVTAWKSASFRSAVSHTMLFGFWPSKMIAVRSCFASSSAWRAGSTGADTAVAAKSGHRRPGSFMGNDESATTSRAGRLPSSDRNSSARSAGNRSACSRIFR
jgi:hypothetical protein